MKKQAKKLVLSKETLKRLEAAGLLEAAGGEDWPTISRWPVDCVEAYITQVNC